MVNDEYTDFYFNEKHSTDMKVWITNSKDLSISFGPTFKDTIVSLAYGDGRILEGTQNTMTQKTMNCVAIGVTIPEWRRICKWLSPNIVGRLRFDFNMASHYVVKLTSIPSVKMLPYKKSNDTYIFTFSLTFATVNEPYAMYPTMTTVLNEEIIAETEEATETGTGVNTAIAPYYFPLAYFSETKYEVPSIVENKENVSNKIININSDVVRDISPYKVCTLKTFDINNSLVSHDLLIGIEGDVYYDTKAKLKILGGHSEVCTNLYDFDNAQCDTTHCTLEKDIDNKIITMTVTAYDPYSIIFSDPALPAGTYTISMKCNIGTFQIFEFEDSVFTYSDIYSNGYGSFTFTTTAVSNFSFRIDGQEDGTIPVQIFSEITFNKGDTALPYEPYYEGIKNATPTKIVSDTGFKKIAVGDSVSNFNITQTQMEILYSGSYSGDLLFLNDYINDKKYSIFYSNTYNHCYLRTYVLSTGAYLTNISLGTSDASYTFETTLICVSNNIPDLVQTNTGTSKEYPTDMTFPTSEFPIPAEIQALNGYGMGLSDSDLSFMNYIDYEKQQFVQNQKKIKLTSALNWSKTTTTTVNYFQIYLSDTVSLTTTSKDYYIVNGYDNTAIGSTDTEDIAGVYHVSGGTVRFRNGNTNDTTLQEWEDYLDANEIYLVYTLAIPVITDISPYIDSNTYKVWTNGTEHFDTDIVPYTEIDYTDNPSLDENAEELIINSEGQITNFSLLNGTAFLENIKYIIEDNCLETFEAEMVVNNNAVLVETNENFNLGHVKEYGYNAIFNTGEITAYPKIQLTFDEKANYFISKDSIDNIYTTFNLYSAVYSDYIVNVDYANNIMTVNGVLLGATGDSSGIDLLDTNKENYSNKLSLESGDAEINYGTVISITDVTDSNFKIYKILLTNDFKNKERFSSEEFGLHIFDIEDKISYNNGIYEGSFENTVVEKNFLLDPYVVFDVDNDNIIYIITEKTLGILENENHYFSLCNYDRLRIMKSKILNEEKELTNIESFVTITPRGVV